VVLQTGIGEGERLWSRGLGTVPSHRKAYLEKGTVPLVIFTSIEEDERFGFR